MGCNSTRYAIGESLLIGVISRIYQCFEFDLSVTTPSSAPGVSVIRSVRYGSLLLARSGIFTDGHLLIGTVSQYITHVDLV